jgi:hypothetical protein
VTAVAGAAAIVGFAVSGHEGSVQTLRSERCSALDYVGSGKPDVLMLLTSRSSKALCL